MKLGNRILILLCVFLLENPATANEFNLPDSTTKIESRLTAWHQLIEDSKNNNDWQKLNKVNLFFNQISYVDDKTQWGTDDYWATPLQFLVRNAGDCEDYSIAKYFTLKMMGVSVERLRITYVNILPSQQAHMVLVYFEGASKTPLVLDNLTQSITAFPQRLDLDPVYSFNHNGLWLASRFANKSEFVGDNSQVSYWKALTDKILKEQIL